jgi:serine/threonine protein phosphatase PrpC
MKKKTEQAAGVREIVVCGLTDTGEVREHNEDAFLLADLGSAARWESTSVARWPVGKRGVLLAVSDGMGGAKAGEVASAISLEALCEGMFRAPAAGADKDDATRLRHVIERANRAVREAAARPDRRGMGATLTAVLITPSAAYVAQIGDSRAYLFRDDTICQVTHDQSYVQMLVDAGAISAEAAEHSPHKNLILQVMGQQEDVDVALGRLDFRAGDRLLLCSDGLTNMVDDDTIRRIVCSGDALEVVCAKLVAQANSAGGDDNITVVLAEPG